MYLHFFADLDDMVYDYPSVIKMVPTIVPDRATNGRVSHAIHGIVYINC